MARYATTSERMAAVRQKHTAPEMAVRSVAHRSGLRFRLHRRDLPGSPDLVFPGHRVALFVHGCFWHRHENCSRATMPKTNTEYWTEKFAENVERDRRKEALLREGGWTVSTIWECETFDEATLQKRLRDIFRIQGDSGENIRTLAEVE